MDDMGVQIQEKHRNIKGYLWDFFFFEQESIKVVINRIDSFSAFKSQKQ